MLKTSAISRAQAQKLQKMLPVVLQFFTCFALGVSWYAPNAPNFAPKTRKLPKNAS